MHVGVRACISLVGDLHQIASCAPPLPCAFAASLPLPSFPSINQNYHTSVCTGTSRCVHTQTCAHMCVHRRRNAYLSYLHVRACAIEIRVLSGGSTASGSSLRFSTVPPPSLRSSTVLPPMHQQQLSAGHAKPPRFPCGKEASHNMDELSSACRPIACSTPHPHVTQAAYGPWRTKLSWRWNVYCYTQRLFEH